MRVINNEINLPADNGWAITDLMGSGCLQLCNQYEVRAGGACPLDAKTICYDPECDAPNNCVGLRDADSLDLDAAMVDFSLLGSLSSSLAEQL